MAYIGNMSKNIDSKHTKKLYVRINIFFRHEYQKTVYLIRKSKHTKKFQFEVKDS